MVYFQYFNITTKRSFINKKLQEEIFNRGLDKKETKRKKSHDETWLSRRVDQERPCWNGKVDRDD